MRLLGPLLLHGLWPVKRVRPAEHPRVKLEREGVVFLISDLLRVPLQETVE